MLTLLTPDVSPEPGLVLPLPRRGHPDLPPPPPAPADKWRAESIGLRVKGLVRGVAKGVAKGHG
jgi:hypothetical protein